MIRGSPHLRVILRRLFSAENRLYCLLAWIDLPAQAKNFVFLSYTKSCPTPTTAKPAFVGDPGVMEMLWNQLGRLIGRTPAGRPLTIESRKGQSVC